MCMFAGKIRYVTSSKIFARQQGGRQALIYEMQLASDDDTAMILPIPVHRNNEMDDVNFVDLSDYADIFTDMFKFFPEYRLLNTRGRNKPVDSIPVQQVGAFEASYVPTQADFVWLDARFCLPQTVWQKLPQYEDYGFVVFKLRKGEVKIHPMAFWFSTTESSRLYFPTVHVHDGEVHEYDDFNHVLYAQGEHINTDRFKATQGIVGSDALKAIEERSQSLLSADSEIYKQRIDGQHKNEDIWLSTRT